MMKNMVKQVSAIFRNLLHFSFKGSNVFTCGKFNIVLLS